MKYSSIPLHIVIPNVVTDVESQCKYVDAIITQHLAKINDSAFSVRVKTEVSAAQMVSGFNATPTMYARISVVSHNLPKVWQCILVVVTRDSGNSEPAL